MIEFHVPPGTKILELGGGNNPHPQSTVRVDVRPGPHTSFVCDFNDPLPIATGEFDVVYSQYCLEHLSWRKVRQFLGECCRVLKPGGKAVFVTANTEAQIEWCKKNPGGWDGKDDFDSLSCVLFGDQDYEANTHRNYLSPAILVRLLREAGFGKVVVHPWGERKTDMAVECVAEQGTTHQEETIRAGKPTSPEQGRVYRMSGHVASGATTFDGCPLLGTIDIHGNPLPPTEWETAEAKKLAAWILSQPGRSAEEAMRATIEQDQIAGNISGVWTKLVTEEMQKQMAGTVPPAPSDTPSRASAETSPSVATLPREKLFDKSYFNGGKKVGGYANEGYRDFPVHEITARHILARRPASVLEIGCARGYVLKRIQAAGVDGAGIEISRHCYMTRATDPIHDFDICRTRDPLEGKDVPDTRAWSFASRPVDLCFSVAVLEHIPREYLPAIIREMARVSRRGLHGIDFGEKDDGFDRTHVTLESKAWWQEIFAAIVPGYPVEIVDKEELERGDFPPEVLRGDGKSKLNLGSHTVGIHHGWINIDVNDIGPWMQQNGYTYLRHDLRTGIPSATGSVDMIYSSHALEHFSYAEGLALLRECRRVLKPETGVMRLAVPDAELLLTEYAKGLESSAYDFNHFNDYAEISDGVAEAPTRLAKLYALLGEGHRAYYDAETLLGALTAAGFEARVSPFRQTEFVGTGHEAAFRQLLRESTDGFPCLSLYVDAVPRVG